ncbi:LysR substrate-binding domain-containing protein [Rugosimonospora acidiphila]|uniref:LysR substrate-binding domain-containing protein n=1 Tax=Rugosimonospora acidiphila TaxID=556531 RepID=A0ABP9SEW5_9ACTN
MPEDHHSPEFRLLVVPGITIDRWSRTWAERLPRVELRLVPAEAARAGALLAGEVDAGLVRLPVDRDVLDAIPLYTEATVAVVPRDHLLAAADELTVADLADETLLWPLDDVLDWGGAPAAPAAPVTDRPTTDRPATTAAAVELVAAGVGVLVVPQSLARLYHRRDLTYRTVTDAPTSSVALAWTRERHNDLVEEMIGIVRGRTANSTRGRAQPAEAPGSPAARTPTARTPTAGRDSRSTPGAGRTGARPGRPNPRTPRRRGR